MHVAAAMLGAAWGVKLTRETEDPEAAAQVDGPTGPSIADMAALARPAGDDTLAASLAIMKTMQESGG